MNQDIECKFGLIYWIYKLSPSKERGQGAAIGRVCDLIVDVRGYPSLHRRQSMTSGIDGNMLHQIMDIS